jgi:EpsI family protein
MTSQPIPAPPPNTRRAATLTPATAAWAGVAVLGGLLLWQLGQYWARHVDAADRVIILAAAAWLGWRGRDHLRRLAPRPSRVGLPLVAAAAVLVPPNWYLFAQVGPQPLLLWWLTAAFLAAVAGLVLLQFGGGGLRAVAFPLAFLLFALPVPQRAQDGLQRRLQEGTTTCAAAVLPRLGVPVERSGFVLRLPSGELGVVEACSGVRSVTAIVAVAALVAHVRGFGWVRGVLFVLLSLPVIALANAVRVVLSGLLQEYLGPWVNEGVAHEVLGWVTLLSGLAGVLALAAVVGPRAASEPDTETRRHGDKESALLVSVSPCLPLWAAAVLLGAGLAGAVGATALAGAGLSDGEVTAPVEEVALRFGAWRGEDVAIDPRVTRLLESDRAVQRVYHDAAGQQVHVWVIYWSAAQALRNYAHHPDVCWPMHGWETVKSGRTAVALPGGGGLEVTTRRYARDGVQRTVAYWVQDGSDVWTEEDERRGWGQWTTHHWVLEGLSRRSLERSPRLAVLVGADVWETTGYAERAVEKFIPEFAAELYRVCPWAAPAEARGQESGVRGQESGVRSQMTNGLRLSPSPGP